MKKTTLSIPRGSTTNVWWNLTERTNNQKQKPQKKMKIPWQKSQYKGTCTTCRKFGHKVKYWWHKEVVDVQNIIFATNVDILRNNYRKKSGKKKKITIRMNITRRNVIISKWTLAKKRIATILSMVRNALTVTRRVSKKGLLEETKRWRR